MTQAQLERAVAHATGDCLQTIQRLGFRLVPGRPRYSGGSRRPRRRRHPVTTAPRHATDRA